MNFINLWSKEARDIRKHVLDVVWCIKIDTYALYKYVQLYLLRSLKVCQSELIFIDAQLDFITDFVNQWGKFHENKNIDEPWESIRWYA